MKGSVHADQSTILCASRLCKRVYVVDTVKKRYNIRSTADLQKIERYRYDIDPKLEPLKKILQHYFVSPEIQCGLSNCHRWHNDGFLVELENSDITNVGHICGSGFGSQFEVERNRYTESILRPQALQAVRDGKTLIESRRTQLSLLSDAANRLSFRKSEFRKRFPGISKELVRRASNGSPVVMESVERSFDEIEVLLAANPRQNRETLRYREIEKGRIAGLQLFSLNIRERIIQELVSKAHALIDQHVATQDLKTDVLMRWESWLNSFNERIAEAQDIISKAESFFNEENYQLIASLPSPSKESFLLKHLKTASLDETVDGKELEVAMQSKKLNRAERRKLQFNS